MNKNFEQISLKPGFMKQTKEYYDFCKGKKIINDIKFAWQVVSICNKIVK